MNLFLVLFWIYMFLFVIYFFNTLLIYIEILACMNSYITWLVSISFPPHYCTYFMEYIWFDNLFWQFFFHFYSSRFKVPEELVL